MKETAKQKVLKSYPNAYAVRVDLYRRFVIVSDYRGPEISGYYSRERDAWTSAAKLIVAAVMV